MTNNDPIIDIKISINGSDYYGFASAPKSAWLADKKFLGPDVMDEVRSVIRMLIREEAVGRADKKDAAEMLTAPYWVVDKL